MVLGYSRCIGQVNLAFKYRLGWASHVHAGLAARPVDGEFAAAGLNLHPVCQQALTNPGHHRRAGATAAGQRLANAALKHAQALAQSKHDAGTRAQGVRHLFRLPVGLEVGLHQTLVDLEAAGKLAPLLDTLSWEAVPGVTYEGTPAQEGPVNLGTLDIHSAKGLSRLANAYRAAFEAGVACVPYFTLSNAA